MNDYRAKPGQEDRHGEMTGAITINMMLSMPPIAVWCAFVGPLFLSTKGVLYVALVLVPLLPLLFFRISRRIWSRISDAMDKSEF